MDKSEKMGVAVGIAGILIPFALEGLGMELHPIFYWVSLAIGMTCFLYAVLSMAGLSFTWPTVKTNNQQSGKAHQSEDEYIASVIHELRANPDTYRMFVQLIYGSDGFHPGIRSVWSLEAGKLFYAGKNSQPTDDEQKEQQSLKWMLRKRLAESSITHEPTDQHWYFATGFGKKVQKIHEAKYTSETRRYRS